MDARQRALECVTQWRDGLRGHPADPGPMRDLMQGITTALERAYAEGNAAHVEHHRCERCYAAGQAAGRAT